MRHATLVRDDDVVPSCAADARTDAHDAAGYFKYFGSKAGGPLRGYYSWDLPVSDGSSWHLVALNSGSAGSSCGVFSCAAGSAQEKWLKADLKASAKPCTLAYWHAPLYSSDTPSNAMKAM